MSEFECRNNHLVDPPYHKCQECGEPVSRMDGYTKYQLAKMEQYEREKE